MPAKRNGTVPNGHFKKDWQRFVSCHFAQPLRKKRRHALRVARAAARAPMPINSLRPIVRCPTVKYNSRARFGRGFTIEEVRGAGLGAREAMALGIAVDKRRTNKSVESLQSNVRRLKEFRARLLTFDHSLPRQKRKEKPQPLPTGKSHVYHALRRARINQRLKGIREKKRKEAAESLDAKK